MLALHNLFQLSLLAVASAVLACAFYLVTQPGEILGFVKRLAYQFFVDPVGKDFVRREKREYYLNPFLLCAKCMSGQAAFWLYLIDSGVGSLLLKLLTLPIYLWLYATDGIKYDLFSHILTIAMAILIGYFISKHIDA